MAEAMPPRDEMLAAFTDRDGSYDGLFVAAVRTTGIFCRSSCPARKPDPRNVEFFATAGKALAAGYRPCLRCRPLDPGGAAPAWLSTLLADLERDPRRRWTERRPGCVRFAPGGGAALVPAPLRDDLPCLRPRPAAGSRGRQPATRRAGRRRRLRSRLRIAERVQRRDPPSDRRIARRGGRLQAAGAGPRGHPAGTGDAGRRRRQAVCGGVCRSGTPCSAAPPGVPAPGCHPGTRPGTADRARR